MFSRSWSYSIKYITFKLRKYFSRHVSGCDRLMANRDYLGLADHKSCSSTQQFRTWQLGNILLIIECADLKSFRMETFFFVSTVEKYQILEYISLFFVISKNVARFVQGFGMETNLPTVHLNLETSCCVMRKRLYTRKRYCKTFIMFIPLGSQPVAKRSVGDLPHV